MANVTVTLPLNMLDKLDDLVEKGKTASRSQAVRDALERFLKSVD
jgi:Arc/MetJ-type ribon-helix-helix transcriptional regulator